MIRVRLLPTCCLKYLSRCVLCATLTGGINPSFRAIASTAMSGGSIVMCQSELLCGVWVTWWSTEPSRRALTHQQRISLARQSATVYLPDGCTRSQLIDTCISALRHWHAITRHRFCDRPERQLHRPVKRLTDSLRANSRLDNGSGLALPSDDDISSDWRIAIGLNNVFSIVRSLSGHRSLRVRRNDVCISFCGARSDAIQRPGWRWRGRQRTTARWSHRRPIVSTDPDGDVSRTRIQRNGNAEPRGPRDASGRRTAGGWDGVTATK